MTDRRNVIVTRWDADDAQDRAELASLLADYHRQTEAEKGVPVTAVSALPAKYLREATDPRAAFREDVVLIARSDGHAAGCLVITTSTDGSLEIKRVWTDPNHRGRHVATTLLHEAHAHAVAVGAEAIRLSVWEWRTDAIALYTKAGFIEAPSWETREKLVCMTRTV